MLRSTGIKRDLRLSKNDQYSNYYYLNFRSYIGLHGDCFDRFLIRMNEMSESINIINQSILKFFLIGVKSNKLLNPLFLLNFFNNYNELLKKKKNYNIMENLIHHFKF
jgi:NADH-quinone oxidoreductase subunit D